MKQGNTKDNSKAMGWKMAYPTLEEETSVHRTSNGDRPKTEEQKLSPHELERTEVFLYRGGMQVRVVHSRPRRALHAGENAEKEVQQTVVGTPKWKEGIGGTTTRAKKDLFLKDENSPNREEKERRSSVEKVGISKSALEGNEVTKERDNGFVYRSHASTAPKPPHEASKQLYSLHHFAEPYLLTARKIFFLSTDRPNIIGLCSLYFFQFPLCCIFLLTAVLLSQQPCGRDIRQKQL